MSDWRDKAACLGYDPEEWTDRGTLMAHRLCRGCPVRAECKADAKAMDAKGVMRANVYFPEQRRGDEEPAKPCGVFGCVNPARDGAHGQYCDECSETRRRFQRIRFDRDRNGSERRREVKRRSDQKRRMKMGEAS